MVKFNVIVADPPWEFNDKLTMSKTPRGAAANYNLLSLDELKTLDVSKITDDNCVLVLWVPSTLLQEGLDIMKAWGFTFKQTYIWVKVKQEDGETAPLKLLSKNLRQYLRRACAVQDNGKYLIPTKIIKGAVELLENFNINYILSFYLGHLFRQTHEIALVGIKGKIYKYLKVKNQRSVILDRNLGHSSKPEGLQDSLDLMFPSEDGNMKLEMFARRDRPGWICVGYECPTTSGEDIRDSIKRLESL